MNVRIEHGTVVTMNPRREIVRDGAVVVRGDRIAAVGKTPDLAHACPILPGEKVIDSTGQIVLPGLVDTHLHHVQTLARGLGDDCDPSTWAYGRIWPFECLLTDESAYLGTLLASLEMIRTGTTCACDPGGYVMDGVGEGITESGLRAVIAWAGLDRWPATFVPPDNFPGRTDTVGALEAMERVVRRWNGAAGGRIRGSYALRNDVNSSDELAVGAQRLARRDGTIVQIHTSTKAPRLETYRKIHGTSPVQHLHRIGALGSNWLLCHAARVDDGDLDAIQLSDARVSHNVASSLHGVYGAVFRGKFPEMLERGITVGLGCDSTVANNSLDMFRVMYLMATVHKEARQDPLLISPEQALEAATINAARAIGWDDEIGSLEPGKQADVIVVEARAPNLAPIHDFCVVPNLVYSGEGSNVVTTIVAGEILYEDRRFTRLDSRRIVAEAQVAAERLLGQLPYLGDLRPRWPVL